MALSVVETNFAGFGEGLDGSACGTGEEQEGWFSALTLAMNVDGA